MEVDRNSWPHSAFGSRAFSRSSNEAEGKSPPRSALSWRPNEGLAGVLVALDEVKIGLGADQNGARLAVDGQDVAYLVLLQLAEDAW